MHQPYYKDILTQESPVPWVRLHGTKDYLDMVAILKNYPKIHQTFNVVPSLLEQIDDYLNRNVKDKYLHLSYKEAAALTSEEKKFIINNFFSINKEKVILFHPRYYDLYLKRQKNQAFNTQDYLDLQVWFNLAWIDPTTRNSFEDLKRILVKERFFTEEEKHLVLDKHLEILEEIIPTYKKFLESGQIELTTNPYYHPILPLLCNTRTARQANRRTLLPELNFQYPQDAKSQVDEAVKFHKEKFGVLPLGMWPSEESVSERIVPGLIESGIKWIVTDEAILFKSLKLKNRDTTLLYQPHLLKRKCGNLTVIFRDRNLSDLIGFNYSNMDSSEAAEDFMAHLKNISTAFKDKDILVTIAMDGENAWEYFRYDGHEFLNELYSRLSEADYIKVVTVSEYLKMFEPSNNIKRLCAGSWIFGNFDKWMNNRHKVKAWEYLALARAKLEEARGSLDKEKLELAAKQIHIAEGSDWFWWYGEDPTGDFDKMFRMHLSNFYRIIGKDIPGYLEREI